MPSVNPHLLVSVNLHVVRWHNVREREEELTLDGQTERKNGKGRRRNERRHLSRMVNYGDLKMNFTRDL